MGILDREHGRIRADGTIHMDGIDFGGHPVVIARQPARDKTPAVLVIKSPSGKCWAGLGMTWRYHPATMYVLRVKITPAHESEVARGIMEYVEVIEQVIEWEVTRAPKKVVEALK